MRKRKKLYTEKDCPLCKMTKLSEWKFVICKCDTHLNKWMLVWGKHDPNPSMNEKQLMLRVLHIVFPNKKWRGPGSIPEHWHYHEV